MLCSGANESGQIGDGTTTTRIVPTRVSGLSGITKVSTGYSRTCALQNTGKVFCWGEAGKPGNSIGNAAVQSSPSPVKVPAISDAVAVASGAGYSCAISANRDVFCWGTNEYGQLGVGDKQNRILPTRVSGLKAKSIHLTSTLSCAINLRDQAVCWGLNKSLSGSLLVDPKGPLALLRPTAVKFALGKVLSIAPSDYHVCAVKSTGQVLCWGDGTQGQIGDGTLKHRAVPTAVLGVTGAQRVWAGIGHSCALTRVGTLYCWGASALGQITAFGMGYPYSTSAVLIGGLKPPALVAVGAAHTCALLAGGSSLCWGGNFIGQLGRGSREPGLATRRPFGQV